MRASTLAATIAAMLLAGGTAHAQTAATPAPPSGGVNAGSLSCNVAGGVGFVFGSSKALDCIFARPAGGADHYSGTVKKFGVDIGFTKQAHIVWLVFAPGAITPGALAGEYVGGTAGAAVGVGIGANALIGGSSKQITLQPVSVEGSVGLNVAAGLVDIELKSVK
ncbi:DUF992 domain-containing protein [Reyranella sp.]|uniref:DUF992 domain-containing protein n=1 Tax=Reyranella sp. TaxID=1929291 RepID=UPI003D0CE460